MLYTENGLPPLLKAKLTKVGAKKFFVIPSIEPFILGNKKGHPIGRPFSFGGAGQI